MTRSAFVIVTVLGICAPVAAQTRPDYSGQWQIVAERSTPKDRFAFGNEFRITQTKGTFSLELPRRKSTRDADGKTVTTDDGLGDPFRYDLDGEEHDNFRNPFKIIEMSGRTITYFDFTTGGQYRASWIPNALVLVTRVVIPYTSFSAAEPKIEWVRREARYSFSFAADGTLIADSETTSEPRANDPTPKPVYFRSVYRRAGAAGLKERR